MTVASGGSSRRTAAAIDDLPHPDSPAMPSVSPAPRSKLTPRTAGNRTFPSAVGDVQIPHREDRRATRVGRLTVAIGAGHRFRNRGFKTASRARPHIVNASTVRMMPKPGKM